MPAVRLIKFILYKSVYVIIHYVIIIASHVALIRLLFVELGFRQIRRKCNIIQYHLSWRRALPDNISTP